MIKVILMPATGNTADHSLFAVAAAIARPFTAHIDVLHVRSDPDDMAVTIASADAAGSGGTLMERLIDELQDEADKREREAHGAFEDFCAREQLSVVTTPARQKETTVQWHVKTGRDTWWMTAYGLAADLIVASRGTPGDDAAARTRLETLLIETGRPLLIPGNEGQFVMPRRVAIGWKATAQAARAVASAMPFIRAAEAVRVIAIEEEDRTDTDRIQATLAWHGIDAAIDRLEAGLDGPAQTLVGAAITAKADLLVMGGYGHTRLREWVFGGFTQHVLAAAPLPVLLAH